MKKIKVLLTVAIFLGAMTLPNIEALSQEGGSLICYTGKKGEVGTWREGACIEHQTINQCGQCVPGPVE
ncbi:hypothetical protein [Roseivirga echinicomitans]|uniref:Uncharacterized protein n=1 Tax=Roseivirga echinicomitans TaxID=296218 RepID=A0A150XD94_9BACT|nr:hypothetical protein [Roseivirga echinicomitans]KYG76709.1 hypothetical protein AWN68_06695 [Roseivirga echinicomitans]